MTLGQWVKAKRNEMGLTRRALANLIGMDQRTISTWERGKNQPDNYARDQLKRLFGELPDEQSDERP